MLLFFAKFIARSTTVDQAHASWKVVREKCIPTLELSAAKQREVIDYIEKNWMCKQWLLAWIDAGRACAHDPVRAAMLRYFVTTDNSTERFWEFYLQFCCKFKMFKRVDYEINAITDFYGNLPKGTCLIDMLNLQDQNGTASRTVCACTRAPPPSPHCSPSTLPSVLPLTVLAAHWNGRAQPRDAGPCYFDPQGCGAVLHELRILLRQERACTS